MLGYDFQIIYKKGKQNVVVDALSSKDEDVESLLYAILILQPEWITEARDEWKNDSLWYKDHLYICKELLHLKNPHCQSFTLKCHNCRKVSQMM